MSAASVQFARASDGLSIAFRRFGDGPPLLFASNIFGDLHYLSVDPVLQTITQRLVDAGWGVIRYDIRGMGASQRDVDDYSLDARIRDIEGLVEHLRLERFALAGVDGAAAVALAYAVAHPQKTEHLILVDAWESGAARYDSNPAARHVARTETMANDEWEFFTLQLASVVTTLQVASAVSEAVDPQLARVRAANFRASCSPATFAAYRRGLAETDVGARLPSVTVPTLVVHDWSHPFASFELIRNLASQIHGASLVEATSPETLADAIDGYLSQFSVHAPAVTPGIRSTSAAVASTREDRSRDRRRLTSREIEVLRLIARGHTNLEISSSLTLSVRTVGRHITNIYAKVGVRSKAEATAYAIHNGVT